MMARYWNPEIIFCYPGAKGSGSDADKVYLGVRVKMPVRDLLKNIRKAQGWIPKVIGWSSKYLSGFLHRRHFYFLLPHIF